MPYFFGKNKKAARNFFPFRMKRARRRPACAKDSGRRLRACLAGEKPPAPLILKKA